MPTAQLQLTINQGADLRFAVDIVGGPESLAGYTGLMQIRATPASAVVLAEYDAGEITVTAGTREVAVVVPAATTAGYTWEVGVYDLKISGPDGIYRIVEGAVRVKPAVTR